MGSLPIPTTDYGFGFAMLTLTMLFWVAQKQRRAAYSTDSDKGSA